MEKFNFGSKDKTVKFSSPKHTMCGNGCSHDIVVCNGKLRLLPPSNSPISTCRCIICGDDFEAEVRHMNYIVRYGQYKSFDTIFKFNREYTEHDVLERLISNLNPSYIMNGRSLVYGAPEFTDKHSSKLVNFDNIIWAYNKRDSAILVEGLFIDGIAFALNNNRLIMRKCKDVTEPVQYLPYVMKNSILYNKQDKSEEKFKYYELAEAILKSSRVDENIKEKIREYLK